MLYMHTCGRGCGGQSSTLGVVPHDPSSLLFEKESLTGKYSLSWTSPHCINLFSLDVRDLLKLYFIESKWVFCVDLGYLFT